MTLAQLRTRLLRLLGENTTTPIFWTYAQADRYLNDAYQDFCRDTGALEIRHGIRAIANRQEYDIPESIGPVMRVSYDDYALIPDFAHQMDRKQSRWRDEVGTPERWIKSREGRKAFRVWRAPSVSGPYTVVGDEYGKLCDLSLTGYDVEFNQEVGRLGYISSTGIAYSANQEVGRLCRLEFTVNDFEVWGKKIPPALHADDSEPEVLPVFHLGIAFRAAESMLMIEGETRNEQLAAIYGALADEYEDYARTLINYRLPERAWAPRGPTESRQGAFLRDRTIPIPVSLQE